jgi:hypothetical protein
VRVSATHSSNAYTPTRIRGCNATPQTGQTLSLPLTGCLQVELGQIRINVE